MWTVVGVATGALLVGGLWAARKAVARTLAASRRWTMRRASEARSSMRRASALFSRQWSSLWSERWAGEAAAGGGGAKKKSEEARGFFFSGCLGAHFIS